MKNKMYGTLLAMLMLAGCESKDQKLVRGFAEWMTKKAETEAKETKKAAKADATIYWQDLTMVAYETMRDDFEHVIKVLANGAVPIA